MLVFGERGKPEYPQKNLAQQGREPTTNSTHMPAPGFAPGPHWWEASVLTTAPPLRHFLFNEQCIVLIELKYLNQSHHLALRIILKKRNKIMMLKEMQSQILILS